MLEAVSRFLPWFLLLLAACSGAGAPVDNVAAEDAGADADALPDAGGLDPEMDAAPLDGDVEANAGDARESGSEALEQAWPGNGAVSAVDTRGAFPNNLSGLSYEAARGAQPAVLWAVQNEPSRLFRLVWNGSLWVPDTSDGWSSGKQLRYPDGAGRPDAEGITTALREESARFLYAASERDGQAAVSRQSVLRFDTSAAGVELVATHEWDLTEAMPEAPANTGLEGIAFIADAELAGVLFDESTGEPYAPADYAEHGGGLFFVGMEATGMIYGFVLNHTEAGFALVTSMESGLAAVVALEYDADAHQLWAYCDDSCANRTALLRLDSSSSSSSQGRFLLRRILKRPADMPNVNNEGISFAPDSECEEGSKSFFWVEDGASEGHAIRRGSIPCGEAF